MSTDRDTTRVVRSWLEEGVTALPDRVLDAVLDQVPATPQRRSWWPARRIAIMKTNARIGLAAAAVLVAVVGFALISGVGGKVTPTTPPPPTAAPTAGPLPPRGLIPAGTYRLGSEPTILVTVPAGWDSVGNGIRKNPDLASEVIAFQLYSAPIRVFADACQSDNTEVPIGPTTTDLLAALVAQENSEVADPVDVTVAGVPGKRLVISATAGLDVTHCSIGSLQIWVDDLGNYLAGAGLNGGTHTVYVADTPGGRLVIDFGLGDGSSADIAERDAIIASIRVNP